VTTSPSLSLLSSPPTEDIIASDGRARRLLPLRRTLASDVPTLVDFDSNKIASWEVELLRWPASAEAALRRGGYLTDRYPDPAEPWCNCSD